VEEHFEYVIEGETMGGRRHVLGLDIGGGLTMKFVRISKGTFLMGAPDGEHEASAEEKPQRRVTISRDFYIGMYAVTQAEYRIVTGQSPSKFRGGRHPVEHVSWRDAMAFCHRLSDLLNRRIELPTEAQWEYACRAGTTTPFHFGWKLNGDLANCNGEKPYGTNEKGPYKATTEPVGTYPANPWGLYDMHGNVWEWCQDEYSPYVPGEQSDPIQVPPDSRNGRRIVRGGSWKLPARDSRAAPRFNWSPGDRYDDFGFRVCFRVD
jgi:formylglycine-generating enzyme required for sulfatase activity